MKPKLKSPTCGDCAHRLGYVAHSPYNTVSMDVCANCGEKTGVSTADDYKLPGEKTHHWQWD